MFASGRSKNAPTDNKNLSAENKEITPIDLEICRGSYNLNYLVARFLRFLKNLSEATKVIIAIAA